MYNVTEKDKFLESLPTAELRKMYVSLFGRSQCYEEKTGKDILHFDADECSGLLAHMEPKSVKQLGVLKCQFMKYVNWGMERKAVSRNHWVLIGYEEELVRDVFSCRNVKNLEDLERLVETGLSVPYDKYAVYLLFMGIMGDACEELAAVKDSDVDVTGRVISTPRGRFHIHDPLYGVIRKGGYYKERKGRDEESAYFVKPYKTKTNKSGRVTYHYVSRVVCKLNRECDEVFPDKKLELVPMTIWRSGLFNRLYEIECVKGEVTEDDYGHVSRMFGNGSSFSMYERDYELYKEVFWGGHDGQGQYRRISQGV